MSNIGRENDTSTSQVASSAALYKLATNTTGALQVPSTDCTVDRRTMVPSSKLEGTVSARVVPSIPQLPPTRTS